MLRTTLSVLFNGLTRRQSYFFDEYKNMGVPFDPLFIHSGDPLWVGTVFDLVQDGFYDSVFT